MDERYLTTVFKNYLTKACRENDIFGFYYKIPDTLQLGGRKPFDSFFLIQGKFFAFEFKSKGKIPTKIQKYYLNIVRVCGGRSYIIYQNNYRLIADSIIRSAIIVRKMMMNLEEREREVKEKKGGEYLC